MEDFGTYSGNPRIDDLATSLNLDRLVMPNFTTNIGSDTNWAWHNDSITHTTDTKVSLVENLRQYAASVREKLFVKVNNLGAAKVATELHVGVDDLMKILANGDNNNKSLNDWRDLHNNLEQAMFDGRL